MNHLMYLICKWFVIFLMNTKINKLYNIISKIFLIEEKEISINTHLNKITSWDSLKHMEFIFALENEFNLKLSGDQIASMTTIENITILLDGKK